MRGERDLVRTRWRSLAMTTVLLCNLLIPIGISSPAEASVTTQEIVVFKDNVSQADQNRVITKDGGTKTKDLSDGKTKVVKTTSKSKALLLSDRAVSEVDDDIVFHISAAKSTQVVPWGVSQINAPKVWTNNTGKNIKVGVLDTGIDLAHPDLKSNIKGGANMIDSSKSANDDNGHGTHVSGIIAGLNNSAGVVGVGPDISLYAIKALDKNGSGQLSDIIEGLNWAIKNKMDVVNMSLGSANTVTAFHTAITKAYNAGITLVAAAGNDSGGAVNYPAAYSEVIAVAATDSNNNIASFSDIGPQVDLAAPGVDIYSTYKSSKYTTLSGTSMATPHVTGAAALVIDTPVGKYDKNNNGRWDPAEVQKKLEDTATDLGQRGKDSTFGAGLVNLAKATQP